MTSPAHVIASAVSADGFPITDMTIFVDGVPVYDVNAASLDTYVDMIEGEHSVVVQAIDSNTSVYRWAISTIIASPEVVAAAAAESAAISANGVGASGAAADFNYASTWMAAYVVAPDGALLYGDKVNPYFANLAAMGMTHDPNRYAAIQNWMNWVIGHLNYGDRWGLSGTIYDYNVVDGQEISTGDADSTDSYAATFLSLAWAYYRTGDPNAQAYVRSIAVQLDLVGQVVVATMQGDGLTWAKPDWEIKYMMDNCEAYRGLADLASIFNAIGQPDKAQYYQNLAAKNQSAIQSMWVDGHWAVYRDWYGNNIAPDMSVWYADASSQLFPVVYQVVPPDDWRAQQAYANFTAAWPDWQNLSYMAQDEFPWVIVADGAALMGDTARVSAYLANVQAKYVNQGLPWTWYSTEDGWYMRLVAYVNGARPF